MVEVYVSRLGLDASSNSYVVILQEKDGYRVLPIWIGQPEAESIIMEMNDIVRERPLTHDLCRRIIVGLGGTVQRVNITRVQKNTYYAQLVVTRGEDVIQVDARPSDCLAMALRFDAPIFAHDSLLSHGGQIFAHLVKEPGMPSPAELEDEEDAEDEEKRLMDADQLKQHLENLRPEDFGKFNL